MFWHGVRNNLGKFHLDISPNYWVRKATSSINPSQIRGVDKDFEIFTFSETEINYVKNTIIGIERKDLL